jgi:cellulose synthase/poly-beta-1,6-N-acetylglucosamine synthase-like glycosyltransferase
VDGDTVYFPDALLTGMRFPMRDPEMVVGVTSNVTISRRPEEGPLSQAGSMRIDSRALTNFQLLDYMRAFLNNRVGWARWNFMLCSVGAFSIWRRDLVVEFGGFSGAFTCEDIEFTFRMHERLRRAGRPFRIVALPDSVGRTEGPDSIASLVSQRARWQRVITETVWHYRGMLFNPRYGSVGLVGAPYYLVVEVLAPIFQVLSVVVLPLAWWAGVLDLREFALFALTVACANGLLTNVALLLYNGGSRSYPAGDLVRLMVLGLMDLVAYRPILIFAQAKGTLDFLRGDKSWNKFERNDRGGSHPGHATCDSKVSPASAGWTPAAEPLTMNACRSRARRSGASSRSCSSRGRSRTRRSRNGIGRLERRSFPNGHPASGQENERLAERRDAA